MRSAIGQRAMEQAIGDALSRVRPGALTAFQRYLDRALVALT
jgi:hypothetical protein